RIFEDLGAGADASMVQTVVMGLVNVRFTLIAIVYVDKFGRQQLLINASVAMAIGMMRVSLLAGLTVSGSSDRVLIISYTSAATSSSVSSRSPAQSSSG